MVLWLPPHYWTFFKIEVNGNRVRLKVLDFFSFISALFQPVELLCQKVQHCNCRQTLFRFFWPRLSRFLKPGKSKRSNEIKIGSFFVARPFDTTPIVAKQSLALPLPNKSKNVR
jgi:hypothetical protein